jgi:hypothetical protein
LSPIPGPHSQSSAAIATGSKAASPMSPGQTEVEGH